MRSVWILFVLLNCHIVCAYDSTAKETCNLLYLDRLKNIHCVDCEQERSCNWTAGNDWKYLPTKQVFLNSTNSEPKLVSSLINSSYYGCIAYIHVQSRKFISASPIVRAIILLLNSNVSIMENTVPANVAENNNNDQTNDVDYVFKIDIGDFSSSQASSEHDFKMRIYLEFLNFPFYIKLISISLIGCKKKLHTTTMSCPENWIPCFDDTCIETIRFCNFKEDCNGGKDESKDFCYADDYPGVYCAFDEISCKIFPVSSYVKNRNYHHIGPFDDFTLKSPNGGYILLSLSTTLKLSTKEINLQDMRLSNGQCKMALAVQGHLATLVIRIVPRFGVSTDLFKVNFSDSQNRWNQIYSKVNFYGIVKIEFESLLKGSLSFVAIDGFSLSTDCIVKSEHFEPDKNLHDFDINKPVSQRYKFTTCLKTGQLGPTQRDCDKSYGNKLKVNVSRSGIQYWRVPVTGKYYVTASGAAGGGPTLKNGSIVSAVFILRKDQRLGILIGQRGSSCGMVACVYCGGGGGASFLINNEDMLLVAGGGGGGCHRPHKYDDPIAHDRTGFSYKHPVFVTLAGGEGCEKNAPPGGFGGGGGGCRSGGGGAGYIGGTASRGEHTPGLSGQSFIAKNGYERNILEQAWNQDGFMEIALAVEDCGACSETCIGQYPNIKCACWNGKVLPDGSTDCLNIYLEKFLYLFIILLMLFLLTLIVLIIAITVLCIRNGRYRFEKLGIQAEIPLEETDSSRRLEYIEMCNKLKDFQIWPNRIKQVALLYKGAYSDVYTGMNGNRKVALKIYNPANKPVFEFEFMQEAAIVGSCCHQNIIKLIGVCFRGNRKITVLELMNAGNLSTFLQTISESTSKRSNYNLGDLYCICLEIAEGCRYLEDLKIVHRNISPKTILLSSYTTNFRTAKIGGFSKARYYHNERNRATIFESEVFEVQRMSPEAILEGVFTNKSDAWAYGVLLWEIFTLGFKPYGLRSNEDIAQAVLTKYRMVPPNNCDRSTIELMFSCWQQHAQERIDFNIITQMLKKILCKKTLMMTCMVDCSQEIVNYVVHLENPFEPVLLPNSNNISRYKQNLPIPRRVNKYRASLTQPVLSELKLDDSSNTSRKSSEINSEDDEVFLPSYCTETPNVRRLVSDNSY